MPQSLCEQRTGQGGKACGEPHWLAVLPTKSWFRRGTPEARIHVSPPSTVRRIDNPSKSVPAPRKLPIVPTATPSFLLGNATAAIPLKRVIGIVTETGAADCVSVTQNIAANPSADVVAVAYARLVVG